MTPLSCGGDWRRLNVFAYWQRIHSDLVNEVGRSVLYIICCVRLCLPSRQGQIAWPVCRDAEWKSGDLQPQYAFIELFSWRQRWRLSHSVGRSGWVLLFIFGRPIWARGGLVSVIKSVATGQYSSLQLTIIWIRTDWSQFLCYSRVGKVRQWLQARNSPLCGTLFRS